MRAILLFLCSLFTLSAVAQTATQSVLYQFKDADGDDPPSALVQASDGNFYGAAISSGANGAGTIYQITAAGTFKTLHSFVYATEGAGPQWLIQGPDGFLYGMTVSGGSTNGGTIFKISLAGQLTVLHTFVVATDGGNSNAGFTLGADGNFYGVTTGGTTPGSIFKMTPSGTFSLLYKFTGVLDGGNPYASLIQATDGNFYGVALNDGALGGGTLFQITPAGVFKVFHTFDPAVTGTGLSGALVQGPDGALYGPTQNGGTGKFGSIYRVALDGTFSTLYSFLGGTNGSIAWSSLLAGGDGNFYGTTNGTNGSVYRMTPTGTFTTLYTFTGKTDGRAPEASLIQGTDGNLYGVAAYGGLNTDGNVFKLTFSSPVAVPIKLATDKASIPLGTTAQLTWTLPSAFSTSSQVCFATVQSGTDASWTGLKVGTVAAGVFTGTATVSPTSQGSVTYALTCGGIQTGVTTLAVTAPLPLSVTTTALPLATAGTAYTTTLTATGGVAPYTWTAAGTLPAGITLSSTGVLSGTAATYGVFPITFTVADAEATPLTATAALSLTVTSATPTLVATPPSVTVTAPGSTGSTNLSLSGFSSTLITLACSGLPHDALCSFGAVSGSGAAGTAAVTITTSAAATAALREPMQIGGGSSRIALAILLPGMALLLGFSKRRRKAAFSALAILVAALTLGLVSGCGGNAAAPDKGTPVGTSTVTVTATAGTQVAMTTITLNVQ